MYRYARGAPSLRGPFCFPRPLRSPSMYGPLPVLPYPVLPCRGTRKRAPEAPTAQRANLGARRESLGKSRHPASRVASLHLASPRLASPRPVSPPPTDPTPSRHSSPCLASPRLASPRPPRLASPHLASPHLASPRLASSHLASSRVLATSARERLVYRFGFRSNYLQRCSRAGEKRAPIERGRSTLRSRLLCVACTRIAGINRAGSGPRRFFFPPSALYNPIFLTSFPPTPPPPPSDKRMRAFVRLMGAKSRRGVICRAISIYVSTDRALSAFR